MSWNILAGLSYRWSGGWGSQCQNPRVSTWRAGWRSSSDSRRHGWLLSGWQEDTREEAALSPIVGTEQAGFKSPILWRRLIWCSVSTDKGLLSAMEFFFPPSSLSCDVLLGNGKQLRTGQLWVLCWTKHPRVRCLRAWLPPGQSFLKARCVSSNHLCVPST